MTLEQVRASYGAEGPTLPPERAEQLVLKEPEWNLAKMAVSATDEDFVIQCDAMNDAELFIDIPPMMNTYEEYFYGLTADSHKSITVVQEESSPIEGKMDRRGGEATSIKIKFEPQGQTGEFEAHLCFILPEEKGFSKYYKITGTTEATRDPEAAL